MSRVDKELTWETGAISGGFPTCMNNTYTKRRKELVLVVDEDPNVKDLTRDILERYGHSVLCAGSKGEVLSFCRQRGREIAVAILDDMVLESNAVDALQEMLEINPSMKVIITSIYNHGRVSADVFGRGAAGFLKKPYRMTDLLRMVEQVKKIQ